MARARSTALRILGVLAGVGVILVLARALDPARVAADLGRMGWGFVGVLGVYLLATVLWALPYGLFLPRALEPGWGGLVFGRLAAGAVNAATPLGGMGGEPVRLLWLPPGERRGGIAALVVDRGVFLAAGALFLGLGAALGRGRLALPRNGEVVLDVVAVLGLALAALLLVLQRGGRVARPVARVIGIFVGRARRERLAHGARAVDREVAALHRGGAGRLLVALALHAGGRAAGALEVWVAGRLIGLPLDARDALLLQAVPLAVDLVLSMVPSQIGFAEGATALTVGALGYDPSAGLALALALRLRQLVFVAIGFVALSVRRGRGARHEAEAEAAPPHA